MCLLGEDTYHVGTIFEVMQTALGIMQIALDRGNADCSRYNAD